MTNQERLEEYLVGEKGYLKESISNGKVIMLSGKWGSGKTHFWQNKIQTVLNEEEKKIPNNYISLYGKSSIQEIKNEIFLKVFESVDSFDSEEKTKKIVKGSIDLVSNLTKSISVFGMSLDLSKITDTSFKKIDDLLNDEKLKRTENYLNSGAIICFDDFERKSKDINLNDLFGFITQLTLNFNCKVVIILNDDAFEGVEKDVFSRVKEKSVSKFLKYEPKIEDLFNLIFNEEIEKDGTKEKKYKDLESYREIILKTIEETEELNARIYIQVLDNLLEWIENKKTEKKNNILRCLILVNINFIKNHIVFEFNKHKDDFVDINIASNFLELEHFSIDIFHTFNKLSAEFIKNKNEVIDYLKRETIKAREDSSSITSINNEEIINQINLNNEIVWNYWKMKNIWHFNTDIEEVELHKINNFIETGILINE